MMKKICPSKVFMFVCIFAAIFTFVVAELFAFSDAEAASADHPAVLLRISTYDNSRHLNISGDDDKSAVVASELKNSQNENWRFDYVGTDSKTYNNHPLATLADNYYKDTLTRAPALMRYGYFHSFNNYVDI